MTTSKLTNCVVYMCTCLLSGKSYIGYTSKSLDERWLSHCKSARCGSVYHFHRAIRTHGTDCWIRTTLEDNLTTAEAKLVEKKLIKLFETKLSGYNGTDGGEGVSGLVHSIESRRKISEATTAAMNDPEVKKRLREGHKRANARLDVRKRKSDSAKIAQNRPDVLRRSSESQKLYCSLPGVKERMSKQVQSAWKNEVIHERYHKSHVRQMKAVEQLTLNDVYVMTFESQLSAQSVTGISQGNIARCCHARSRGKIVTAGGYRWKFVDSEDIKNGEKRKD